MLSKPLTKAIQTTEGALVVVSGIAVAVTSAIDPSTLSHKNAALIIGAQNVALLIQRGVIKSVALLVGLGVVSQPKPALSAPHQAIITGDATELVKAVTEAAKGFQAPESAAKPEPIPAPTAVVAETPAPAAVVPATAPAASVDPLAPVPTA